MPTVHSKILLVLAAVVVLIQSLNQSTQILDAIQSGETADDILDSFNVPPSIGTLPPKDIYGEIHNTVWFKHHTGLTEDIFDYICDKLSFNITEARNVDFKYDAATNYYRKRRPCKISTVNRIIHFLHTMRTGDILWNASKDNNWNTCSVSKDFCHVLYHFVKTFDSIWIRQMNDTEKNQNRKWIAFPTAYSCLDGTQFQRRKSTRLPDGVRRKEMYCYKHRWAEGQNVQAVINHFGIATEVWTGLFFLCVCVCN